MVPTLEGSVYFLTHSIRILSIKKNSSLGVSRALRAAKPGLEMPDRWSERSFPRHLEVCIEINNPHVITEVRLGEDLIERDLFW